MDGTEGRCVLRHPHRTPWVPERDWPEVRGEECRPRTVLSWLLAKWVVGESEEAGRRTLSSHGPENPEEKEIALSLRRWVPLALGPAAEQKQNET